jgi:hypothetical protein
LNPATIMPVNAGGVGPIGMQVTRIEHGGKRFRLVANDISRNVTLLDFNTQAILGGATSPAVAPTASLPAADSIEESRRRGKKFFKTGLARWSLKGQGWGSCEACHTDGLTDNVTFYFARGPRQSISLDGSFNSKDPKDQRILNWTAIVDEIADFELNGDAKWTISSLFYGPSAATTAALKTTSWSASVATFPASLLPAVGGDQVMRFAGANAAALDQIVCVLRNVGTFGAAEAAVAANGAFPEIRANGAPAQGNQAAGNGFNPPSLLATNIGAPYLHDGGARTLEALFAEDPKFAAHYRALSPNFLMETGAERATKVGNLVKYLLSIDEDAAPVPSPASPGANGGSFCKAP